MGSDVGFRFTADEHGDAPWTEQGECGFRIAEGISDGKRTCAAALVLDWNFQRGDGKMTRIHAWIMEKGFQGVVFTMHSVHCTHRRG